MNDLAAEWAVRVDGGELPPADDQALQLWLSEDTRHHGAYIRARAGLKLLDRMADQPASNRGVALPAQINRRTLWIGGAAAAASVAAGALVFTGRQQFETFTTGQGEIRRLAFPGGAELVMDAGARLHTAIARGVRLVRLDFGRVAFDISRTAPRPLVVEAGDLRLETSDASFSARREAEKVDLLVEKGSISALNERRPAAQRLTLEQGAAATLVRASLVRQSRLSPEEAARAEAWQSGGLMLDGETVAQAVMVFNRFNAIKVVVASPDLARQPLAGFFYLNDPIGFTNALETTFGAKARRNGDEIVVR